MRNDGGPSSLNPDCRLVMVMSTADINLNCLLERFLSGQVWTRQDTGFSNHYWSSVAEPDPLEKGGSATATRPQLPNPIRQSND